MGPIASQITSLTIVYSAVYSGADQENIKAPRYWPLCGKFTGEWWIFSYLMGPVIYHPHATCFTNNYFSQRYPINGIFGPSEMSIMNNFTRYENSVGISRSQCLLEESHCRGVNDGEFVVTTDVCIHSAVIAPPPCGRLNMKRKPIEKSGA